MSPFVAELTGTAVLITLGSGVVANVLLDKTKGNNSGLMVIALAWAVAVFVGVYISADISGAHLNPAVTIGLAVAGKFSWNEVPSYLLAQLLGAFIGAVLAWLTYKDHFSATKDPSLLLAVFSTGPAIRKPFSNLLTETIATFIFMLSIFYIQKGEVKIGRIGCPSRFIAGAGHWSQHGWSDRVCHQSRPGPWPPHCPCHPPHPQQRGQ